MANDIGHFAFAENCCHLEAGDYRQQGNLIVLWIEGEADSILPMLEGSSHLLCRAKVLGPQGPLHSIQSALWFREIQPVSGKLDRQARGLPRLSSCLGSQQIFTPPQKKILLYTWQMGANRRNTLHHLTEEVRKE